MLLHSLEKIQIPKLIDWCPRPESNRHDFFESADFKSAVSTDFTTRACANNKATPINQDRQNFSLQGLQGAGSLIRPCLSHSLVKPTTLFP